MPAPGFFLDSAMILSAIQALSAKTDNDNRKLKGVIDANLVEAGLANLRAVFTASASSIQEHVVPD